MWIRHDFLWTRVARRILWRLVLSALVPLSLLGYFVYSEIAAIQRARIEERLHAANRWLGLRLSERLFLIEEELLVRGDAPWNQHEPTAASAAETAFGQRSRRFVSVERVGPRGRREVLEGSSIALPDWTPAQQAHLDEGKTVVHALRRPGGSRILMARYASPGRIEPVLIVAELGIPYLLETAGIRSDREAPISVFCEGVPLVQTEPGFPGVLNMASALLDNPASGHFEVEGRDHHWLASYRSVFLRPHFLANWTVVNGEGMELAFAPARHFRVVFLLSMGLAGSIVLWLGLRQIRGVLVPLALLREAAGRLGDGEEGGTVVIESGDEFEDLGESFNAMSRKIQARTTELVQANQAKGQFLANMSHELRTPMTAILGYAELASQPDADLAGMREYVGIIRANGDHLLEVIDEILDFSRLEAGRMTIRRRVCSARELVEGVVELLRERATVKGLSLELERRGNLPRSVRTDPKRLRQILLNVVGNAIKFTEEGSVRVVLCWDGDESGRGAFVIDVVDTGPGIPEAQLDSVFERFAQVDSSMSRRAGGTGLGLSISRALARLLGGDLTCFSEEGVGTRFRLTFDPGPVVLTEDEGPESPEVPSPATDAAPAGAGHADGPPPRVLLAEDVAVNRRLVSRMLERLGAEVDEAQHGAEAVESALEAARGGRAHDLVLMDIQMPVVDGYEATSRLRAAGYSAPIVALTSHAVEGERQRCLAAGCDDFATKPITLSRLREVLDVWGRRGSEADTESPAA